MDADLRHVTVRAAGRSVDLSLPAAAPIAELTPALARLCEADGPERAAAGTPAAWTLARANGPALGLTASLGEAGVRDGEVLHLVDAASWRAAEIRALADVVSAAVDLGPRWTREATAAVIAGTGILLVLVAALIAVSRGAVRDGAGPAALLAAAGLVAGAIALRPAAGLPRLGAARTAMVAGGWLLAGLGAWGLAGAPRSAAGVAAAALAGAVVALAACPVVPALGPGVALAAATLAAAAGAVAAGAPRDVVTSVVAMVGLAALRPMPRLASLLATALPAPARLGTDPPMMAVVRRSRRLLTSLSYGAVSSVLAAALLAFVAGAPVAIAVAAVAALSLPLVTWPSRLALDVLPAAVAAGLALVGLETTLVTRLLAAGTLVAIGLPVATGLALAAVSAAWTGLPARALRRPRTHAPLRDHRAG
jgi:WXG100 protein secretion system (Wss), protein YukD